MYKILSTKKYTIHHKKGHFIVAVSEHDNGSFHGTVVDYELEQEAGQPTRMDFSHKVFHAQTEQGIEKQWRDWVDKTHGPEYTVTED
jgi:uncharacterized protein YxjI